MKNNNDEVSFAYCIPYTYSQLQQQIVFWKKEVQNNLTNIIFTQEKLCQSLGGLDLPLLTISGKKNLDTNNKEKPFIIFSARVHPGESNSSWMLQGLVNFLISNSEEAQELRSRFTFKIIPMLNPDGVAIGNYRTGFGGKDLNRQYAGSNLLLFPTVAGIKQLVNECKKSNDVLVYIDFHGHSIKPNVFMYGPEYQNENPKQFQTKFIPKILETISEMFSYEQSIFSISSSKKNTSRGIFFKNFGIDNCYTIEASFGFFKNKKQEIIYFDTEKFIGINLIKHLDINQWGNKYFLEFQNMLK